tara:strand:- start:21 stop:245 length:225 start_codon:yes stop_codon:yes gene_type:complete
MYLREDVADRARASKAVKKIKKAEAEFRKTMYELDKVLKRDKVNKKLSTELTKEYRSNVTKFMRTMLGLKKKVK